MLFELFLTLLSSSGAMLGPVVGYHVWPSLLFALANDVFVGCVIKPFLQQVR